MLAAMSVPPAAIDTPDMRAATRERLSLALMDARNHTLQLLARFEGAPGSGVALAALPDAVPPAWLAGHLAWHAEYWISRNPQRALGPRCPADGMRLASVDPQADSCFDPRLAPREERWKMELPDLDSIRAYLLDTLETTLELLDHTPDEDAALHFYRVALFHEDLRGEDLVVLAQAAGVPLAIPLPAAAAVRPAIGLPATRVRLGWNSDGFAPGLERGDEVVQVPEFEIDAQPVNWSQYVEFIADGGYDHPEGWHWLEAEAEREGRRGPRHVEQIGVASGAVLQTLFGRPVRMAGSQPVLHVNWWEADAWARWAGRRLPTEPEWQAAALQAGRRGFRWGDVREWTASTLRPFTGYASDAWAPDAELDPQPFFGRARVLRGASFAARARMKHPLARAWALPERDDGFTGFRTCAL
jgi:iron(II)-dependent oxidoreductase